VSFTVYLVCMSASSDKRNAIVCVSVPSFLLTLIESMAHVYTLATQHCQ